MASYSGKVAPVNGTIYVCNLPEGTDDNMLAEYFGTIGLIKKDKRTGQPKIWLYHDKVTNEPKGDATITYEDPHAAVAAVEWFNNKEFHGSVIGVFIAQSKGKDEPVAPSEPIDFDEPVENAREMDEAGGRGRGRGDAAGKAWKQDGDWTCPNTSCTNVNFAFRGVCNRCGTARPAGFSGGGGGGAGRGRGRGATEGSRAATGSTGLFGPNDWTCPMCANINWAKRMKCNVCNTNKPGISEGGVRGRKANQDQIRYSWLSIRPCSLNLGRLKAIGYVTRAHSQPWKAEGSDCSVLCTLSCYQASWTESRPKLEKDPQGRIANPDLDEADLEKLFREHVKMLYERCVHEFRALLTERITTEAATKETEDGKTVLNSWSTAKRLLKSDPKYAKMPRKDREALWKRHAEELLRRQKVVVEQKGDRHNESKSRSSNDPNRNSSASRSTHERR